MTDTPDPKQVRRVRFNSLLLSYEMAVLRHFELEGTPFLGGDEQDLIDRKTAEAHRTVHRIRQTILDAIEEAVSHD